MNCSTQKYHMILPLIDTSTFVVYASPVTKNSYAQSWKLMQSALPRYASHMLQFNNNLNTYMYSAKAVYALALHYEV